jgi:hypothetical protein
MNVKIQGGGGGTYANTGSCTGVVTYLQHEDLERIRQGQQAEPFFNQYRDFVSPSEKELAAMGASPEEQARAMKEYIRKDIIPAYAENFNKGLQADNIEYYAKIHYTRTGERLNDMHAHIIVSRKDRANKLKLSPKTNHRGTAKGAVRGGFDRTDFFRKCERCFDVRMNYNREIKESFEYLNAIKNGTTAEIRQQAIKAVQHEAAREASKEIGKKVTRKIVKGMGGMGL